MNSIHLSFKGNKEFFRPKEQLWGRIYWMVERPPKSVEINLIFYTVGKGTEDVIIVDKTELQNLTTQEEREFAFKLPEGPYSFSGQLISVIWAVEAIIKPSGLSQRKDFLLSPMDKEILLPVISINEAKNLKVPKGFAKFFTKQNKIVK